MDPATLIGIVLALVGVFSAMILEGGSPMAIFLLPPLILVFAGTGGRGTLSAGALEMSNVDLGQEFTGLIIAQRGFQANSKVITTSDQILNDLVNMKQ